MSGMPVTAAEPGSEGTHRPWKPVPGPADRETFFAAQARDRRTTWRLGALCIVGLLLMGIPMSAVITPLGFAALILLADVVYLLAPGADLLRMLGTSGGPAVPSSLSDVQGAMMLAVVLIAPGATVMALAWLGTLGLLRRAGPEALVHALGGRAPRAEDIEERQLENVVAEMAIAAGVKPPRVMLLDGATANAAAVGSSHDDAVVLVSRRLLDELDRDETQGVVAHLIGTIGNGDLRVSLSMLSLFRTIALVMTALGATLGPASRRALFRLLRLAIRRPAGAAGTDELAQVDELLVQAGDTHDQDIERLSQKRTGVLDLLRFPFLLAHTAIWLCRLAFMSFVVGPLLALVWRSRRYLADASAVQLTRNPDGVARGLAALSARGGMLPAAGWAAPLFIIGPRSGRIMGDDFGLMSFDPPMAKRMERLRRQGANVDLAVAPAGLSRAGTIGVTLLLIPLGTALVGCALAITWVALAVDMLLLSPVVLVLHFGLRRLVGG